MHIRNVLQLERPILEPVDVGEWTATRDYSARDPDKGLADFSASRLQLIAELQSLTSISLTQVGIRADGTEIDIMGII